MRPKTKPLGLHGPGRALGLLALSTVPIALQTSDLEEAIAAALEAGEPPPPPEAAGPDDAQLIVLDVTPPALDLGGGAWDTAIVTTNEIRLAAFSPSKACLSSDGRFAACVLSDGKVACYHLPLPPPAPPSASADANSSASAGKGSAAAAAEATPAAPPPMKHISASVSRA